MTRVGVRRRLGAVLLAAASTLAACSDDDAAREAVTTPTSTATTTATTAATTTLTCAPSATARSQHERVDVVGGSAPRDGWYFRYVPARLEEPAPALVVDLHGFVEGATVHTRMSAFDAVAEREGFVLVTPQSTGEIPFWNSGRRPGGPPDLEFLSYVIEEVEEALCTDPRRVFVTGLSNGGFMTSTLGCELADRVAAIAPVAGVRFDRCTPSRPMPVVAFHGTEDELVPFDPTAERGDEGSAISLPIDDAAAANFAGIVFRPVPDAMADWAAAAGCDPEPVEEPIGADVVRVHWAGCDGGADVELYRVEGGGHTWPGSDFSASLVDLVGVTTHTVSASEVAWAFFEAHPLP